MLHRNMKGNAMTTIDILTIERRAREMRAREVQRLLGLLGVSLRSLLQSVGKGLRLRFSWNPQHRRHC
jgi:hypothetical protein